MKNYLLILCLLITSFANAQTVKQLKQHRLNIKASKSNQTAIVSLDTFFCYGTKYAVVKDFNKNAKNAVPEYFFKDLKTGDTMIKIRLMSVGLKNEIISYYNYYFPALRSDCDVAVKEGQPDIYETVCKLHLLNIAGLDTFKAETFISLNGNLRKKTEMYQNIAINFKMVERNRKAQVYVYGNNIYQDSIIIGSFEETEIKGPVGELLNHVEIFNTQKKIVSFSTETSSMSHDWRTVTNMDSKYHLIKSGPLKEGDIFYLINFLIDNLYL